MTKFSQNAEIKQFDNNIFSGKNQFTASLIKLRQKIIFIINLTYFIFKYLRHSSLCNM